VSTYSSVRIPVVPGLCACVRTVRTHQYISPLTRAVCLCAHSTYSLVCIPVVPGMCACVRTGRIHLHVSPLSREYVYVRKSTVYINKALKLSHPPRQPTSVEMHMCRCMPVRSVHSSNESLGEDSAFCRHFVIYRIGRGVSGECGPESSVAFHAVWPN
jgi:hypothetical protein